MDRIPPCKKGIHSSAATPVCINKGLMYGFSLGKGLLVKMTLHSASNKHILSFKSKYYMLLCFLGFLKKESASAIYYNQQ